MSDLRERMMRATAGEWRVVAEPAAEQMWTIRCGDHLLALLPYGGDDDEPDMLEAFADARAMAGARRLLEAAIALIDATDRGLSLQPRSLGVEALREAVEMALPAPEEAEAPRAE